MQLECSQLLCMVLHTVHTLKQPMLHVTRGFLRLLCDTYSRVLRDTDTIFNCLLHVEHHLHITTDSSWLSMATLTL
jgi:hypothetical protein